MDPKNYQSAIKKLRRWQPTNGREALLSGVSSSGPKSVLKGLGVSAGALMVAGLTLAAFLIAKPAGAVSLEGVATALREAKAVHIIQRNAKGELVHQHWKQGSRWRREFGFSVTLSTLIESVELWSVQGFDGRDRWSARPGDKVVQVGFRVRGEVVEGDEPATVQSIVDSLLEGSVANPSLETVRKGDFQVVSFIGKRKSDSKKFKIEITADPASNLPVEQRYFHFSSDKRWLLGSVTTFDYPESFEDAVFAAPQQGYITYHYRKIAEQFEREFSSGSGSKTVNGVTITPLVALQEEDGTVLVFWKGGAVPPINARVAVFGTDGRQHVAGFWYEDDDRTRQRNHGVAPKTPAPKIPRDKLLVKLRPFGYHKGEPFYCIQFNPGQVKPNTPQTYNVVLPVCASVEPYIQQPTPQWVRHEATGREVGVATFRFTTSPVAQWFYMHDLVDPDHMFRTGAYPATNIGMTKRQVNDYRRSRAQRQIAQAQGG